MIIENKKAAKRFLCLGFGLLLSCCVMAQETEPYAAEKARIREIKLSGDYYYADVSAEDAEDAWLMARKLLALEIQGQETGCERVADLLQDSCRYVRLKRLDRPRVFAYITKETVAVWLDGGTGPSSGVPEVKDLTLPDTAGRGPAENCDVALRPDTLTSLAQGDTSVLATVANLTVGKDSAGTVVADKSLLTDTTAVEAVVKNGAAADTLMVTIRDTVMTVVSDTLKIVIRDTVSLTVTDTVRTRLELRTTGNDRLDRLLQLKTIAEVQPFFIAEKKAGRMMFGKISSATRPEECYLLFFDREGKVVAVLGKGSRTRLNLLTGQNDSADRYREGNGVIWFLLYE